MKSKRIIFAVLLGVFLTAGTEIICADTGSSSLYGNTAAKVDTNLTIDTMLRYAVEDEYLARAEYVAIMQKFGTMRPFSSIKDAETTHVGWISEVYKNRNLVLPPDQGAAHIMIPATLKEAYETGVQAEIDNIQMYDRFLDQPVVQEKGNRDLKTLFLDLKRASENHLSAFKKQLSKY